MKDTKPGTYPAGTKVYVGGQRYISTGVITVHPGGMVTSTGDTSITYVG